MWFFNIAQIAIRIQHKLSLSCLDHLFNAPICTNSIGNLQFQKVFSNCFEIKWKNYQFIFPCAITHRNRKKTSILLSNQIDLNQNFTFCITKEYLTLRPHFFWNKFYNHWHLFQKLSKESSFVKLKYIYRLVIKY